MTTRVTDQRLQRITKALADPTRFGILAKIAAAGGAEVQCAELRDAFPVTPATMSHHLKELVDAGLIDSRRDGQCVLLRARRPAMAAYLKALSERLADPVE